MNADPGCARYRIMHDMTSTVADLNEVCERRSMFDENVPADIDSLASRLKALASALEDVNCLKATA